MSTQEVTILILAAGASSRMGRPKQSLKIQETSLLRKTVQTALHSKAKNILVLLGSEAQECSELINDLSVEIFFHNNWAEGMGSSLKAGIKEITTKFPSTSAVIVSVCDQPLLSSTHFDALLNKYNSTGVGLVAAQYNKTLGTPVLFDKKYFSDLLQIGNAYGARVVLEKYSERVTKIPFSELAVDLDTPEEYSQFLNRTD